MQALPLLGTTVLLGLALLFGAGCAVDRAALVEGLEASAFESQTSGVTASLRGVCAVDPGVAWASGSSGTILRTRDGGATWDSMRVPGAEDLDFRDIHALDDERAWVISAGLPARIYQTGDGGHTWILQHESVDPGVFFDAIEFVDARRALAFSDPVLGHLLIVRTEDGGETWTTVDRNRIPRALSNEAGFAASGSGLAVRGRRLAWIGLGGDTGTGARVFRTSDGGRTWHAVETPMISGESAGVFSLAFRDDRNGIAVGGDYREPDDARANAMITEDGGLTWTLAAIAPPRGYRSVVRWVDGLGAPVAIAAGPTGTDFTVDGGQTWRALDDTGYHSLSLVPGHPSGWAVGAEGRIARIRLGGP